jgi:hypothetical protein
MSCTCILYPVTDWRIVRQRIEWFKLVDLPTWKRNKAAPGKFYLISPFIGSVTLILSLCVTKLTFVQGFEGVYQ